MGGAYVTSIAGYVGTKSTWEEVEENGNCSSGLRSKGGQNLPHATDCIAEPPQGEFAHMDQFFRHALLFKLSDILAKSDVQAIWSAIVLDDWNGSDRISNLF